MFSRFFQLDLERVAHAKHEVECTERHVRRHLLLYLALCLRQPRLFAGLLEFYAGSVKAVKRVVHAQVRDHDFYKVTVFTKSLMHHIY